MENFFFFLVCRSSQKRKKLSMEEDEGPRYNRKNMFYVKVDEDTVIPLVLILQERRKFKEIHMMEIIQTLELLLPGYFFKIGNQLVFDESLVPEEPTVHKCPHITFNYTFTTTSTNFAVLQTKKGKGSEERTSPIKKYEGGEYNSLKLARCTLVVKAIAFTEDKKRKSGEKNSTKSSDSGEETITRVSELFTEKSKKKKRKK